MSLPRLPRDILLKMIKLVGEKGHQYIWGWLREGRDGRDMVYAGDVLNTCLIYELCCEAVNIFPGEDGQPFFERCLEAGNPEAMYCESVLLALVDEDLDEATSLVNVAYQNYDFYPKV